LLWIPIWILNRILPKNWMNLQTWLCSRNKMIKRCFWFRVWNPAMYRALNVKVPLPNIWRG
jgi:hypothetical protein